MTRLLVVAVILSSLMISCKSQENCLDKTMPLNNILIYKSGYYHSDNKVKTFLVRINKKEKTFQSTYFIQKENKQIELDKTRMDSLFYRSEKEYLIIRRNKIKTKKIKLRHKRVWYDFATPKQKTIKSGGIVYIIQDNKLITPSKEVYELDTKLMLFESQQKE